MSKYTTELRYICETFAGLDTSTGYKQINEVLDAAIPQIFDFDFPIYNENHRNELERKILRHYYTREIGCETVGLWKLRLETKLNEIMPYFNELYDSKKYLIDPLDDADYTKVINGGTVDNGTENGTDNRTNNYTSNADSNSYVTDTDDNTINKLDAVSDTPQGALTDLINNAYLSGATKSETTEDKNSTSSGNSHQSSTNNGNSYGNYNTNKNRSIDLHREERVKGKMSYASKSKMVQEYRKAILNVDMMVIEELEELFMLIY